MNTKKALSLLTAAVLSVSSFAALAVTASADSVSYIYASTTNGAAQTGANGAITGVTSESRYNSGGRAGEGGYTIDTGVSAALMAEFDSNNDNIIDGIYTDQYMDYIKSVSISVDLPAGVYTIYYVGVNTNSVGTVTAGNTTLPSGAKTTLHTGEGKAKLEVYAIKNVCFPSGYSGDIVFDNGDSWLPDVTAIKIVQTNKTQNDVIVVDDITRPGRENNFVTVSGATANESYSKYSSIFGADYLSGITKFANYTDSADYYYVRVTEAANYNFYILSENTTGTNFTVENAATGATTNLSTGSFNQVGTYSSDGKIYAANTGAAYLTEGIYKINLVKSSSYYSNLIAVAMHKMDYGTASASDNTVTLTFGADSIASAGGTVNNSGITDSLSLNGSTSKAILMLPYIEDLSDCYKVDVNVAHNNGNAAVTVKAGDTQIASISGIATGGWQTYNTYSSSLTNTNSAKGNISLEITLTDNSGGYCGNYAYVKLYKKTAVSETEIAKGDASTSILSNTGSSYQRFTDNGGNPADAYMTSIDFNSQYAASGLKWYITKNVDNKNFVATYGDLGTTFSGGTVYFGLVLTGTEDQLNSITKVELK